LLPMLSAVLAVVGLVMLAALVPGVLTLLAAVLAMVALMGVLLAVTGRLLADEGEPDDESASKRVAETAVQTPASAPASTTRVPA
jgi:ABC-type protease/lipase transport system fused ATPase/permease subunit